MPEYSYNTSGMKSGHSHYLYAGKISTQQACYYSLSGDLEKKKVVTVFLPYPERMDIPYVNWLLNDDLFGKGWVTKDAEDGIYNGFKYEGLGGEYADSMFRLVALRMPIEFHLGHTWSAFRKHGFTEMESLWLMQRFKVEDVVVNHWYGNSNHFLMEKVLPFHKFTKENFRETYSSVCYQRFPYETGTTFPEKSFLGKELSGIADRIKEELKKGGA